MTTQPGLNIARGFTLPLGVVTEATAIVATRGAGKSSVGAVLVEEALDAGVQTVVVDWTGVFWGLRSSKDGDSPGLSIYVLGGPHGDVAIEASAGRFIADLVVDSGHSFVLDLSDFTKGQLRRFCADLLERLFDRKSRARTSMLLVIDEAHELAPQAPRGGFKGDGARLMGEMERTVSLGRSRGIGAVLITQRTQALNKAVLDLIETLMVMRMLSPRAVAAVREWISVKHEDDEQGVLSSLPDLPTGTLWVWSPLRGILKRVIARRIRTFDSYRTPQPGEVFAEPRARKELDLDALGEQIRATVERTRAEDPRELHRRIKQLQEELARRPTKQVEKEIPVEVPVLDDAHIQRLEDTARALSGIASAIVAAADQIAEGLGKLAKSAQPGKTPTISAPVASPPRAHPTPKRTTDAFQPSPAQQRILNALAALAVIGVTTPAKTQLALFAEASPKSSGYTNNLGALRGAGLIDYPLPGAVMLTEAGAASADATRAPQTVAELHAYVRSLIGPGRSRLLDQLIAVYPNALPKAELAERAGVSATSSGYTNNLGSLRSFGLIDYPTSGHVVALPVLFFEDTRVTS
jgi:hypothetical protein